MLVHSSKYEKLTGMPILKKIAISTVLLIVKNLQLEPRVRLGILDVYVFE